MVLAVGWFAEKILGLRIIKRLAALGLILVIPAVLSSCKTTFWKPALDFAFPPKPGTVQQKGVNGPPPVGASPNSDISLANAPPNSLIEVTLTQAVLVGLSNNKSFQVQRLKPSITSTSEQLERSAFDPTIRSTLEKSRQRSDYYTVTKEFKASAGVAQFLPTGTTVDFETGTEWNPNFPLTAGSEGKDPVKSDWSAYSKLSITQALLRGGGLEANLAGLRKTRIDTAISQYELMGIAQTLTAEIEKSYWDYFLALGKVHIYGKAVGLAKKMVKETRERITAGQKAESEIFFLQAEAATQEQSLIDAKSAQEKTRITLLRLMSPPSMDLWNRHLRLLTKPKIPEDSVEELQEHVQVAMSYRPDINQARLEQQKGQLEIVKTKNGLLPKLDLFIMLGRTGYSETFAGSIYDYSAGYGGADVIGRLKLEIPVFNRRAEAEHTKSVIQLAQQSEAVDNLLQLAQQDVLLAYVEIHRAKDQMAAASRALKFQFEKLEAQTEKYRLGVGSAFQVAQAQRDIVSSQISALQARIEYLKGLTQFYVAEGSLLARRGIGYLPVAK
jgi:outer membrane protein TolC